MSKLRKTMSIKFLHLNRYRFKVLMSLQEFMCKDTWLKFYRIYYSLAFSQRQKLTPLNMPCQYHIIYLKAVCWLIYWLIQFITSVSTSSQAWIFNICKSQRANHQVNSKQPSRSKGPTLNNILLTLHKKCLLLKSIFQHYTATLKSFWCPHVQQ